MTGIEVASAGVPMGLPIGRLDRYTMGLGGRTALPRGGPTVDRAQIGLDVFDYGNFREYLVDWFEAAQRLDSRVSHRWFAQRLGSSNPSVLHNVISGRRSLTDE